MKFCCVVLLVLLIAGCRHNNVSEVEYVGHPPWPKDKTQSLELQAAANDPDATWKLYIYYACILHDDARAEPWFQKSLTLRHPQAQRSLVMRLRRGDDRNYKRFGATVPDAVHALLKDAARTSGDACFELADAIQKGYFGKADAPVTRSYYRRGSELGNRLCWRSLSVCLERGIGGPISLPEAYFWTSLEAQCVDPRSLGGKETWTRREKLAAKLSLGELETQWAAVDVFMGEHHDGTQEIDFAPFLGTAIKQELREEGQKLAETQECIHRKTLRDQTRATLESPSDDALKAASPQQ